MENYTLKQAIATMSEIASNPSPLVASLFTAEDVLNILKSIKPSGMPENWQEDVKDMISRMIEEDFTQMADYDEFRVEINYGREIEVTEIGCDRRSIRESARHLVDGEMTEYFGCLEYDEPQIDKIEIVEMTGEIVNNQNNNNESEQD